jgi:mannosyl-3-phosphoglycerate phosphatase
MMRWLVFSDLDGTLLDDSYQWQEALPAIEALREASIPLILNSSKTRAEMVAICHEMKLDTPCIAENGGVVHGIENAASVSAREELLKVLKSMREEEGFCFEGFADWSLTEVMDQTDLLPEAAQQAMQRDATEPIVWQDSADRLDLFREQLAVERIALVKGGRFWHVMPAGRDKGSAMQEVVSWYEQQDAEVNWKTLALGDSPNDWPMLERADVGIVIPNLRARPPAFTSQTIRKARSPASAGWNSAVLNWLHEVKGYVEQ